MLKANEQLHGQPSLWTRLRCSRCRYVREHPGPVTVADLDGECALCGAPLGAVTVYRVTDGRAMLATRPS
jgi:hypothetical protein